jgi:hypothetical protein
MSVACHPVDGCSKKNGALLKEDVVRLWYRSLQQASVKVTCSSASQTQTCQFEDGNRIALMKSPGPGRYGIRRYLIHSNCGVVANE